MIRPRSLSPWVGFTRRQANEYAESHLRTLRLELEVVAAAAKYLPAGDPNVSATRAIITARGAWGTRREPSDPDEVLHPHHAFQVMCREPLHYARRAGPALRMLQAYPQQFEAASAVSAEHERMLLHQSMTIIDATAPHLERAPLHTAIALQIAAAEVASQGTVGLHLHGPTLRRAIASIRLQRVA
jgi:hypothetical protein